ncbi:hypothetical protein V7x_55490 [Crateriforma conspicua]|uniref:Acyltransferase 3 domain-containing protein n=1 Tax=Crateriforma conspicua TaxID=2527996 RepID=A0A5C6FDL0_9PLAN|nr:acyltransferase [Crateriforma conspicua]TWU59558.1 hypothetical protein V7x_55490 [Crateriforma conspicua]
MYSPSRDNTEASSVSTTPRREISVDILKAICIFAVCYIHGSHLLGGDDKSRRFMSLGFGFCVPVFISLLALFSDKSLGKIDDFKQEVRNCMKRARGTALLYIIASLGYIVLTAHWSTLTPQNFVTKHWLGYGWSGQYFFLILLQFQLIQPLFRRIPDSFHLLIYLSGLIVYPAFCYLPIQEPILLEKIGKSFLLNWLPYVSFGILLAHQRIPLPIRKVFIISIASVLLIPLGTVY